MGCFSVYGSERLLIDGLGGLLSMKAEYAGVPGLAPNDRVSAFWGTRSQAGAGERQTIRSWDA